MLRALVAATTITAALALFSAPTTHAGSTPGQVDLVAIDTDPTGNQPNGLLGPVDSCREVAAGETFTVDVIVDSIDPGDHFQGFQFAFVAPSGSIEITGYDVATQMLGANPGAEIIDFSQLPKPDGSQLFAAIDLGQGSTAEESGSGVLTRLELHLVHAGNITLRLDDVIIAGTTLGNSGPIHYEPTISTVLGAVITTTQGGCAMLADLDDDGVCAPGQSAEYCSGTDNCPDITNPGQENADGDGTGDACDGCPQQPNESTSDSDHDGTPNPCDPCPHGGEPAVSPQPGEPPCAKSLDIDYIQIVCDEPVEPNVEFGCDLSYAILSGGGSGATLGSITQSLTVEAVGIHCWPTETTIPRPDDVEVEAGASLTGTLQGYFICDNDGLASVQARIDLSVLGQGTIQYGSQQQVLVGDGPAGSTLTVTPSPISNTLTPTPSPMDTTSAPAGLAGDQALSPAALPAAGRPAEPSDNVALTPLAAVIGLCALALGASTLFARRRRD